MNRIIISLGLAWVVSGCAFVLPSGSRISPSTDAGVEISSGSTSQPQEDHSGPYRLAPSHWSDVAKIRAEAESLASKITAGQITKVEAARSLDRFRIKLVGHNVVDDNVFQTYLSAAIDSNRGALTNVQSKNLVKNVLSAWHTRWKQMQDTYKPRNPAFSNFLNETMGLPYLQ
ncbi:MAG: prokaryotic membrane lipolipid attachment site family protein [Neisseriaceae bacterium]